MSGPPKKAKVDHEIGAIDNLVVQALGNPAVLDELKKHFVQKGEHEELKGEHEELKGEHEELKDCFDHLTNIFEPSIVYSLFETAIYEFVARSELPVDEDYRSKAKHAMAVLCRDILKLLLCSDHNSKKKLSLVGLSLRNKGKTANKDLTREQLRNLVLRALQGLVEFIEIKEKSTLQNWSSVSDVRNTVVHNGAFLDAIFGSPSAKANSNANKFGLRKKMVREYRTKWEEKSKKDMEWDTLEDAVEAVVEKMNSKHFVVVNKVKENVLQRLKELIGEGGNWKSEK